MKGKRIIETAMAMVLIVILCSFPVFGDANYQITRTDNTEYAVFTLTYSGAVTGLQVTSPGGAIYNAETAGAAYK